MPEVYFSRAALSDLAHIADDLAVRAGVAVAERFERRFNDAFDLFERHPDLGSPRPEFGPKTRLWAVPPYVIFYDRSGSGVVILRVLHGRRKITPDQLR